MELFDLSLILIVCLLTGLIATKIGQPALIGFIVAGVALGPSGLNIVPDQASLGLFASIGVITLMFIVGLEVSLPSYRRIAVPVLTVAAVQLATMLLLCLAFAKIFDWSIQRVIVLSMALSIANTALALRLLDGMGELRTIIGQIAVGLLLTQDLLTGPILVVNENLSSGAFSWGRLLFSVGLTAIILFGMIWLLSRPKKLSIPFSAMVTESSGLLMIAAIALCLLVASATQRLGLSAAFGAFLAGLSLSGTQLRSSILGQIQSVQDLLMAVFFVAVGLLLDVQFALKSWPVIVSLTLGVTLSKAIVGSLTFKVLGYKWRESILAGATTASVGEFAFVIGAVALAGGVLTDYGYQLLISLIVFSLVMTAFLSSVVKQLFKAPDNAEAI